MFKKRFNWNPFTWGSSGFFATTDPITGEWDMQGGLIGSTKAGVKVTPQTALQLPVVFACIKVLSDSISNMPLKVYENKDGDHRTVSRSTEHEVRRFRRPHKYLSMLDLKRFIVSNICLSGNAFVMIARNRNGDPVSFTAVEWDCVQINVDDGALTYLVTLPDGQVPVSYENMLHFKILSIDGIVGLSPVVWLAESMGLGMIARDWAASFMKSGGWTGGYLIYDQFLTEAQQGQIEKNVPNIRKNGHESIGKVGLIQGGPKLERTGLSPKDSQFIEARQFSDEEIAAAYGVPMWLINRMRSNSYVGSGLEQQMLQFLIFGMDVYLKEIESEFNNKIFAYADSDRFVEFERRSIMQMDSKARADYYKTALGGSGGSGWMSVNDVQRAENMPLSEGKQYEEVTVFKFTNQDTDNIDDNANKQGEENGN